MQLQNRTVKTQCSIKSILCERLPHTFLDYIDSKTARIRETQVTAATTILMITSITGQAYVIMITAQWINTNYGCCGHSNSIGKFIHNHNKAMMIITVQVMTVQVLTGVGENVSVLSQSKPWEQPSQLKSVMCRFLVQGGVGSVLSPQVVSVLDQVLPYNAQQGKVTFQHNFKS